MSEAVLTMSMSLADLERVQALYSNHKIELREGKIIIMPPSDGVSSAVGVRFSRLLANWVYQQNIGEVLESSSGFHLPNGDVLAPDVSFISYERLEQLPRTYVPAVPELIVEIKSSRDSIRELEEKIALFLSQGVQVGLLIDPDKHTISVYRPTDQKAAESREIIPQKTTLGDGETLSIPDLFPGLEIPITSLWPPMKKK